MAEHPKIENAPGVVWRPRKSGWIVYWQCRSDLRARGFKPATARLWAGAELTDLDRAYISDQCQRLQAEMLMWACGGIWPGTYNGTLRSLIECYQTDRDSSFLKLRFGVRQNHTRMLTRVRREKGETLIADINARMLLAWHREWFGDGRVAMAHGLIGQLRALFRFGMTILEERECSRCAELLHNMRFPVCKPRSERLTAEQVNAIRAKAREIGMPSIALAVAFQFECSFRQKDVIGEWVPRSEPGLSDVVSPLGKWINGLRWNEIDRNLILRHTTSKRQKDIVIDLKLAPMVLDELPAEIPTSGPIIVCEATGRPWTANQFRHHFRLIARACGIPDSVKNFDARAGAISEATDAGAELEHVRHAATHSDVATTARYSRGSTDKIAEVMRRRIEHRNKTRTP